MIKDQTYFYSEEFHKAISNLSQKADLPTKFSLKSLKGGRNNRVFCVIYQNHLKALLKVYFQHPNDLRDRLKTEYSFMNFAWNHNVHCLPRPIAADFKNNLGLYEFIEGRKLSSSEIDEEKIRQALNFFFGINNYKDTSEAKGLSFASEACFSINDHFNRVKKRIEKLKEINDFSEVNRKAIFFVKNELLNEWKKSVEGAEKFFNKSGFDYHDNIPSEDMCISPSDFGYHNALLKEDRLYFIDFEYSGLDDPAKMVCDFFCQPEVPVQIKYFDYFVEKVASNFPNSDKLKQRIITLLPLYKVKWCCILLNEFLDTGSNRRAFAYVKIDYEKEKVKQLEKAKKYLERGRI